jgi:hypothetical protein
MCQARCERWAVAGVGCVGRAAGVGHMMWVGAYPVPMVHCGRSAVAGVGHVGHMAGTVWVGGYPVPTEHGGRWTMLGIGRAGHAAVVGPCSTSGMCQVGIGTRPVPTARAG